MTTTKTTSPAVGTEFTYRLRRPWGNGQMETETVRCRIIGVDSLFTYEVAEVLSVENKCPNYRLPTGGGISRLGWVEYIRRGIITLNDKS